jgi:elongation of very long chain fatty acids protein 4
MVVYNAGQVALNAWMVYRCIDAVLFREHPFIGDIYTVNTGATYAVWIHYCDKYLEFFDTFFMVLRGRMDQVRSFRFSVNKVVDFQSTRLLHEFRFYK